MKNKSFKQWKTASSETRKACSA